MSSADQDSDLSPPEDPAGFNEPFAVFEAWFASACAAEINDPSAMALACVDPTGLPDVRAVLMKAVDARGFVFYTNFESDKGRQLIATPKAAVNFHWKSLRRQVRARGLIEQVTAAEADTYFAERPRLSQVGAWASDQSQPIADRAALIEKVRAVEARFGDGPIPRPPHWSGFRLQPLMIEFWRDGAYRLHDRIRFRRSSVNDPAWVRERLSP